MANDDVTYNASAAKANDASTLPSTPIRIGNYQIVRVLGEGGMGIVFEAVQEHPRRTVALKVIKSGIAGSEALRRFEQESQALGRLQHSGIAQIYEAGTADTGFGRQPYFAMEFIRGQALRDYVVSHRLNTRQRMELVSKICDAAQHAHQRGLIHRDLKPGNILVNESGEPKILDFGVARITNDDPQTTLKTATGQIVGTLAYMSPEQVMGDPLDVDTRSDIYALGVILYELLAERLPHLIDANLQHALQTIREKEPQSLGAIDNVFRGDIETIVAKAMDKDKARRYTSASEFAADIRRYLNDEPITARTPSVGYQLRKFTRRHRTLVTAVAAVFAVLIAGIIVSTWQAVRAGRAEQAVLIESATSKAVNDFLQNDLLAQASAEKQAGPNSKPDPDLKVRTALDRAAARIDGKFGGQPLVEASIRHTVGTTYDDLGLFSEAQRQLERAVELRRRFLGDQHTETLQSMHSLATALRQQAKFGEAEPVYIQVLEMRRQALGNEHPETLETEDSLAQLYMSQAKYTQAEPLFSHVLAGRRRLLGDENGDTANSMISLASIYFYERKFSQAEELSIAALSVKRRVEGNEHPSTLTAIGNLAAVYQQQGKYGEAEPLYIESLQTRLRVLGDEHPTTLTNMTNLASLYRIQGKYDKAEELFVKALEGERRSSGEDHPRTLNTLANLAALYQQEGKYVRAETLHTQVFDGRRRILGKEHPDTLSELTYVGQLQLLQKKYAAAEATLRQAHSTYLTAAPNRWERFRCESLLGATLAARNKLAEAEPLLISGYEGMVERQATMAASARSSLTDAGDRIVSLYQVWGRTDQAAEWQRKIAVSTPK